MGLVSVKAPSWRVAESRRVCANHHRELTPQETSVEKKTKVGQVGPCQDCKAQKRIKARDRCETCYQKHRKAEKAKASPPAQEFPTRVQYLEMDSRKYAESLAILRALVMELDEWHTEDMVDHMGVPELVTALKRHHQATVDRWKAKADRLEKEVTEARAAGSRMMVGAAATLAARAADELEPWASERDAVVGMMLRSVVDTLEAVNG